MWYLTGRPFPNALAIPNVGFILTPHITNKVCFTGKTWAADTGRFGSPDKYEDGKYLAWLKQRAGEGNCLFASAPDVVCDPVATLEMSIPMFEPIKRIGYPVAFVGQDGMENYPIPWWKFDVFFIGGSTEWKLSDKAAALVREAHRRNKWVHMGRVNTWRRMRYAASIGCDSVDGNLLAFGPDANLPKLKSWMQKLQTGVQVRSVL